jgi:hypothetical protein
MEPYDAVIWAFLISCNRERTQPVPLFCNDGLDYDTCLRGHCPYLQMEFMDDAIVLTPDNA